MSTTKILAGVAALLILAAVWVGLGVFGKKTPIKLVPLNPFPSSGTSVSPGGTSSGAATMAILAADGSSLIVRDFVHDGKTLPDPSNSGHYYIAGGVQPWVDHPSYQTFYVASDQSFHITLYKEPLGQNRILAEQELMGRLTLSKVEMCKLTVSVAPGPGVNPLYDGQNLGFSFCPGATQLP